MLILREQVELRTIQPLSAQLFILLTVKIRTVEVFVGPITAVRRQHLEPLMNTISPHRRGLDLQSPLTATSMK
jgi:hypothetical protein